MSKRHDIPPMESEVSGRGSPIVLVPGGLTGWRSLKPHAEVLSQSRQVIRVQLHNVALGLAGKPLPPEYSAQYEIAALEYALDDLGIEKADFFGWSYGGEVLLSFAINNPARVRTLTLMEPPAHWVRRSHEPVTAVHESVETQSFFDSLRVDEITEEQLAQFIHASGLLPQDLDPSSLPQWPVWVEHRQSLRIGDIPDRHEDDINLVRTFDRPVLLVRGKEGSNPADIAVIEALAEELPNARTVAFPGGHGAPIVSFDLFIQHLTAFVDNGE